MLHCSCDIVHSPHFLSTEHSVWRAFHQSGTSAATNICSGQGPHSSSTIKRLLRALPHWEPGEQGNTFVRQPRFPLRGCELPQSRTAKPSSPGVSETAQTKSRRSLAWWDPCAGLCCGVQETLPRAGPKKVMNRAFSI